MSVNERLRKDPINPFVDWGFKYVFGREENKDLLIGFLNLLLEPEVAISDIRYLNTELLGDSPELKRCVVDVLASDAEGNRYLIEMQNASDHDIRQRLVYYACRLVDQMGQHRQEWGYDQIKRVYAICLMNFTYERNPSLRNDFQLRNAQGDKLFSDLLNIIPLQYRKLEAALYLYDFMSTSQQPFAQALDHAQIDEGIRRIVAALNVIIAQNEQQLKQLAQINANTQTLIRQGEAILMAQVATAQYASSAAAHARAVETKIDNMNDYLRYGF